MKQYGFLVGVYLDPETNRQRWAVIGPSNVWYFPARYGVKAAHVLCKKLNLADYK